MPARALITCLALWLSCAFGGTTWAQRSGPADRHSILSRNGSFYRGTIVERIEDSHLVIALKGATEVRIERGFVLEETDEDDPPFRRSAIIMGWDGTPRSGEVVKYKPGKQLVLASAPQEPIELSEDSEVCFVDTRERFLLLRSGVVYRGVIVERVAGSHLTLQTPDGALRPVRLADILRETAAPPGHKDGWATLVLASGKKLTDELSAYEPGKQLTLRSASQGLRTFPLTAAQQVLLPTQLSTLAATQPQESPASASATTASNAWAVATTTGSIYFGKLFMEPDSRSSEVSITTYSGQQTLIAGRQITGRWRMDQLGSVPVERIVIASCPWSRIVPAPVREIFIAGEAPFRATIRGIKPGHSITIRRLDATSPEPRSVSFDELEQIRRPPDVRDTCLPAPASEDSIPVYITSDHTLTLEDKDKESVAVLHASQTVHLLPEQLYHVSAPGVPRGEFQIPPALRAEVRIHAGSMGRHKPGITLISIGWSGFGSGVILGIATGVAYGADKCCGGGTDENGFRSGSPSVSLQTNYGKALLPAGIAGVVGLVLLIAGHSLYAGSSTDIDVDATPIRHARTPISGPRLTARGLEF